MSVRAVHRPIIVTAIAVAAIVGLVLGRFGWEIEPRVLVSLAVVLVVAWRGRLWWLPLVMLGLGLGLWRAESYRLAQAILTDRIGATITVTGTVVDDPLVNDKNQSDYRVGALKLNGHAIVGIIRIKSTPVRLLRGYRVALTGTLESGFATWNGSLFYPQLTILSTSQSVLERVRQNFFIGIRSALPEPEASFGLGLLVGVGGLIPKPLQLELTRVGLSHLVAVSGYNLTIIVRLVSRLLSGLGRNVALVLSIWLIGVFVVLSGASSSIVRAGVVSILSLLATHAGRHVQPLVLTCVAAAGTALFSPAYLNDIGWLLSFLAFFGILVVAPAIMERFGEPKLVLGRMVIETLAAQLLTLPLIVGVFSQLSLIALVANVVVEPFVPLAMLASLAAGLIGLWLPLWGDLLAAPSSFLLGLILEIISALAALPWAMTSTGLQAPEMIACYVVIAGFTYALARANRRRQRARFAILDTR